MNGMSRVLSVKSDLSTLLGNGIINADGDLWKIQRIAGLRFFSNSNLKLFIDQVLPPYLRDIERRLENISKGVNQHEDLQDVFLELTTLLMGKMAYDVCVRKEHEIPLANHSPKLTLPLTTPLL